MSTPHTRRHLHPAHQLLRHDPDAVGREAEKFARFFGTTKYLGWQSIVVAVWITINVLAVDLQWDPYPFILLNLAFSLQAAYAAPLILLAQNRQDDRDRATAVRDVEAREVDYAHNLESLAVARLIAKAVNVSDEDVTAEIGRLLATGDHTERLQQIAQQAQDTIVSNEPPSTAA